MATRPTSLPKYTQMCVYGNVGAPTTNYAGLQTHLNYVLLALEGLDPYLANEVYEIVIWAPGGATSIYTTGATSVFTFISWTTPRGFYNGDYNPTSLSQSDWFFLALGSGVYKNDSAVIPIPQATGTSRNTLVYNSVVYPNMSAIYDTILAGGATFYNSIYHRNAGRSTSVTIPDVPDIEDNLAAVVTKLQDRSLTLRSIMQQYPDEFGIYGLNLLRLYYFIRADALPDSLV